jgi:hypothetical protein
VIDHGVDGLYRWDLPGYPPGGRIEPGAWGRGLTEAGPNHPLHRGETLLEKVRAEEFPQRPSRMRGIFAWVGLRVARRSYWYGDPGTGPHRWLYEVAVPDEPLFMTDHRFVPPPDCPTVEEAAELSRFYWAGVTEQWPRYQLELVTEQPLTITRVVSTAPPPFHRLSGG